MSNTKVILLEAMQGVGKIGEVVAVKAGFARNYLLPRGKALVATKGNLENVAARKGELEAKSDKQKAEAQKQAAKFDGLTLTLNRHASETGQLYGSVKARDIAVELQAKGHKVEASEVMIGESIKIIGPHKVRVVLHPEVIVDLTISVERQSA
ncbi:MAG TPA: 50S ribosomal protein L9 [Alphaproteobacteria bacterium]|nr:50S ribosomal protein L9 [Alphaproteobacteria bacterium]